MKKTLSAILVAVMLLSTLVSLVVPAAAADGEGNWKVMHNATYVEKLDKDSEDDSVPPLAGYKYTENGFETISPDYTNYNPKFSVVSQDKYSLADFTMTVEIKDYSIFGDNWFSFTIWDRCNGFAQGESSGKYGYGWTCLIRDTDSNGEFDTILEFDMSKKKFDATGKFDHIGTTSNFMKKDDVATASEEEESAPTSINCTLTFAIKDGKMSINGKELTAASNDAVAKVFTDGLAYIGVTVHSSDASGEHKPTVTITDVNGEKPTGTGKADPEVKNKIVAPIADSSTVPFATPAIFFDASFANEDTKAANKAMPSVGSCRVGYSADNENILVTADAAGHYWQFGVKNDISYNAADFRMVAFLFKNLCTCVLEDGATACEGCEASEAINLRYCAGKTTAPDNDSMIGATVITVNPVDENGDPINKDEHYTIAYAYINDESYVDRIHAMRMDIAGYDNYSVEGKNQYEIVWGGVFSNAASMLHYVHNNGYNVEGIVEDLLWEELITEADIPKDVDVPTTEETTTKAPTETTTAPAATTKEETTTNAEGTTAKTEENSGCGSVVSMGAIAIVTVVAGTGIVTFKKKKED